jgi:hypothetical protein
MFQIKSEQLNEIYACDMCPYLCAMSLSEKIYRIWFNFHAKYEAIVRTDTMTFPLTVWFTHTKHINQLVPVMSYMSHRPLVPVVSDTEVTLSHSHTFSFDV